MVAGQVIGQPLTAPDGTGGDGDPVAAPALVDPRDVTLKILERQRQLVRIEPFRTTSELRPLELPDDLLQAVDLAVAGLEDGGHVAHQLVQQGRIGRQSSMSSRMPDST